MSRQVAIYRNALALISNDNCGIGWADYPDCMSAADAGEASKEPDLDSWCHRCVAMLALDEARKAGRTS